MATLETMADSLLGAPKENIYKINFRGRDDRPEVRFIKAKSEAEAVAILGVNRGRIDKIRRDLYRELDERMPKSAPSLALQARILAVFSAQVSAGMNASVTFDKLLRNYKQFKQVMPDVLRVTRVSEKLALLKFDQQLILLAEVGEESGRIGEVIGNAADELIERQKIWTAMKAKIIPGLALALLGIVIAQALPIFMVQPMESIQSARGIKMSTNVCTTIMLFMGRLFADPMAWYVQGGIIAGAFFTRMMWWPLIRDLPAFKSLEDFFRVIHSYRFVSAFHPLYSRGVNVGRSIELIRRYGKGDALKAYTRMQEHLNNGGSLGGAFEDRYWDEILRDCMRGFDSMTADSKLELLKRVTPLMAHTVSKSGDTIGTVLGMIGLFVSVGVTMVVFLGLTLPLLTVSTDITAI